MLVGRTTAADKPHYSRPYSSGAEAVRVIGRSVDDQSEITFVENDNSTILAQIQQTADRTVIRHRVGYIRFDTGGTSEKMRIDSFWAVVGQPHADTAPAGYASKFGFVIQVIKALLQCYLEEMKTLLHRLP